ncbi:hypothetical protein L3Q82_007502 [Scortum barcoo]|uniref:Uncharacterized protein n=1 Tax=Scortum barcoo TaxID=214431 RepID=A0ACB8WN20_9TELE|nr:hypothetical protein L3Q82_007502 [Scortum barcoo]
MLLQRRVSQDSPTTSRDLRYSGRISSTPSALPLRSLLDFGLTSAKLLQLDGIPYFWCLPASTMEAENMVHSDSMSPASLGICEKLFRRWELKTSLTEGSARRSQQTLTIRLGLPGLSNFLSASGSNSPPGGDRLTAQPSLSSPECPRHTAWRSDETTITKSIIDLRPRGVLVPRALMDTLKLEHGVRYGQTVTSTEVHRTPLRVQIGEAVPPNHAPPSITVVAHVSIEVPQ